MNYRPLLRIKPLRAFNWYDVQEAGMISAKVRLGRKAVAVECVTGCTWPMAMQDVHTGCGVGKSVTRDIVRQPYIL